MNQVGHGGKRQGAGAKKGVKTGGFDKLKAHQRLQEIYWQHQERMTEAQAAAAAGMKYLVARNKKGGKFTHLTEESAKAILSGENTEDEIVQEWEKIPSPQAFAYLTDQALGRPTTVVEATVTVQGLEERIRAATERTDG